MLEATALDPDHEDDCSDLWEETSKKIKKAKRKNAKKRSSKKRRSSEEGRDLAQVQAETEAESERPKWRKWKSKKGAKKAKKPAAETAKTSTTTSP